MNSNDHSNRQLQSKPIPSCWGRLPVELQIKILANCSIRDLYQLKLVCRAFSQLLSSQEQSITRQYLRERRHGTLPSAIDGNRKYTRHPGDDVVLLSDLFPPTISAKGGHIYTFRYLASLQRRQQVCSKLCYYLADRVVDRFVRKQEAFVKSHFLSKEERRTFLAQTVAFLCHNLTPIMYYVHYFLETYTLALREKLNSLLREFEDRRLSVPILQHVRRSMYRELQVKILRSPPFSDTPTLISTHHCMHLLLTCLKRTFPSNEIVVYDNSWIASLLTVSPFARIVEYFSAEIGTGGNQREQRKDFMYNFHNDLKGNKKHDVASLLFDRPVNGHQHTSVDEVWFEVARSELAFRQAVPHPMDKVWAGMATPILLSCESCYNSPGWHA